MVVMKKMMMVALLDEDFIDDGDFDEMTMMVVMMMMMMTKMIIPDIKLTLGQSQKLSAWSQVGNMMSSQRWTEVKKLGWHISFQLYRFSVIYRFPFPILRFSP